MTSKEALERIIKENIPVYDDGFCSDYHGDILEYYSDEFDAIEKDLKLIEYIKYAREHSTEGKFSLPNGKQYSCDMGYVEEFLKTIEKEINKENELKE